MPVPVPVPLPVSVPVPVTCHVPVPVPVALKCSNTIIRVTTNQLWCLKGDCALALTE